MLNFCGIFVLRSASTQNVVFLRVSTPLDTDNYDMNATEISTGFRQISTASSTA